jgi:hypothetical protein
MTRAFLAAGVAALAIAVPATAGPGGHGGGRADRAQFVAAGGGGGGYASPQTQRADRQQARQDRQQARVERQQARPQRAAPVQMRVAAREQVRAERPQIHARAERPQIQARAAERQQVRTQRVQQAQAKGPQHQQQAQTIRAERQQQAQTMRAQRQQQAQNMRAEQQQRVQTRMAQQQQMRVNRQQQVQAQMAARQQLRANNVNERVAANQGVGYGVGGCPPGLQSKGCMPPGQAAKMGIAPAGRMITAQNAAGLRAARVDQLNDRLGTRLLAPAVATSLLGAPVNTAPSVLGMGLNPIPQEISYLYPATPQYYYQYTPGYVYQVDRSTSLIDALIPLLAGGYLPGSYLPSSYMNSYVPDYYGLNSFYPSSYDYGYGYNAGYASPYGYQNLCNRYAYGVVYQVDCITGMVENVIPTYAGGYGVGQMLPSAYSTYNVPMQYRDLYYPTADYSYWYAPGAIYQYDPSSSLITSVAALMAPGFTVGQPLPVGYDMYNVPMAYRSTYYDTPNAWYRYNNGYIYQVDPATQLVTAIVASLLT